MSLSRPSLPYAEVIGDPIAQSKSPAIHGFWLEKLGIEAEYRACHVTSDGLRDYLADRRADPLWRGCNVTMPHKQAVMPLLDSISPTAARIGAVNTIVRADDGSLAGTNTDAQGFLEPLAPLLERHPLDRRAGVIGTGGAARAIVTALANEGFAITLAGRYPAKAEALLAELAVAGEAIELARFSSGSAWSANTAAEGLNIIINASALGMAGQPPLAFDFGSIPPGGVAYDIVTSPLDTAFLKAAQARGLATIDGLAMLIGQADRAFSLFFNTRPPREYDAELRSRILA